jgi:uncharacterized surface protein with fasciclin (FAS1) repeats
MKSKLIGAFLTLVFTGAFATQASAVSFPACVSAPAAQFNGTIVDAALATPDFSTLVTAVTAAGLGDLLATAENITVYAPTNAAFAALPEGVLTALLADVDALTAVLAYHVSPGIRDPRRFIDPRTAPTLAEQPVFYHWMQAEPMVNTAGVSCTPVRASNGVIYVIDSVLMPQS